ncbi:MAG: hypothetical protein K2G86_00455, partial [Prevotella sp.]|nr:hypothetical protein [Prevotella sp.]
MSAKLRLFSNICANFVAVNRRADNLITQNIGEYYGHMEIKKNKRADLERGRATRFLLGLILVLALFFAAIEIPFGSGSSPDDTEPLDELFHEDDLIPLTTLTRRELSEPLPKAPKTPETVLVTDGLASEAIPETLPSATDGDDESLPAAVEELPA